MHICTLFSEELTKALFKYLRSTFHSQTFVFAKQPRTDSIAYEFVVDMRGNPDDMTAVAVKYATAHFLHGYIAGIEQCKEIVAGEGEWERDAVQASVDNLS